MSNKELASVCHPERLRYVGESCKACYFKEYRKRSVSTKMEFLRTPEANVLIQEEIKKACEQYAIRYNHLKKLGKLVPLDEGNGERAREIWAELDQIYGKIEGQSPTVSDEKN